MLVLSRKIGERIRIGDDVTLTVVRIQGDKVRLGIEAPDAVSIHREEVYRRLHPGDAVADRRVDGRGPRPSGAGGSEASLSKGRSAR